eukprot:359084-Chlamydomonas_euryale.AAC.2
MKGNLTAHARAAVHTAARTFHTFRAIFLSAAQAAVRDVRCVRGRVQCGPRDVGAHNARAGRDTAQICHTCHTCTLLLPRSRIWPFNTYLFIDAAGLAALCPYAH